MSHTSTIQVRIDLKTKRSAQKVLEEVGIDLSSAIKVYLRQIVIQQGIPFKFLTENGLTLEQERAILMASEEAKSDKGVDGPFSTSAGVLRYLKKKH